MSNNARRLPGVTAAEFGEAVQKLAAVCESSADTIRRFIHAAFHQGEGQVPGSCEQCRQALDERLAMPRRP